MGNDILQAAIVGVIVLGAVAYLLRKYLPRRGGKPGGCGSCSGCKGGGCH